jgi:hypothetical protein
MLTTLLVTVLIVFACVVMLCVNILLKKNGTFPNSHIDGNQALQNRGIRCARSQHYEQSHRKNLEELLQEYAAEN